MICAKITKLALIVSICLAIVPAFSARAASVVATPDSYWPATAPLQIAGYKFGFDGALSYLEIYNDSDELLDPSSWTIQADFVVKSTTDNYTATRLLKITPHSSGLMKPNAHAIVDTSMLVSGASYSGTDWGALLSTSTPTITATITISKEGYKNDTYSLKALNDMKWYTRAKTTTGYAAISSTVFSASAQETLYDDGLYIAPVAPAVSLVEVYAYSSDCTPEDASPYCGDYLKFHIDGVLPNIEDYVVRTDNNSPNRTSTNTFSLEKAEENGEYLTIRTDDDGKPISLTNSGGYIWLEDKYQGERYGTSISYPSFLSSNQGWSYALSSGIWQWTTTPQPMQENVITPPVEEVVVCPAGKYLNPDTGRCRTIEEAVNALAACPEGQERNPLTNRCRTKVVAAAATLTPCGEGQERNPATNRCRSIASAVAELMPCDEGYERNPATNRCRKVAGASTTANPAQVIEEAKGGTWNAWTWALVGIGVSGAIGYGVYEWRHELRQFGISIAAKLGKK
jgi:hypothetical protein